MVRSAFKTYGREMIFVSLQVMHAEYFPADIDCIVTLAGIHWQKTEARGRALRNKS